MLFKSEDFKDDFLKYEKDFEILNNNTIYLGPNGIGKTTTYKTIKTNNPSLGYFSYDDCKEKVIKEKKKLLITIRTTDIFEKNSEKNKIIEDLNIKQSFINNGISSAVKASEYSILCKEIYNDYEKGIINFKDENLKPLLELENELQRNFILKNFKELQELNKEKNNLEAIKKKIISEAIELLEKSLDKEEKVCPICGKISDKNILDILKERKLIYSTSLAKVCDKYIKESNNNFNDIYSDIHEMTEFVCENNITEDICVNYILIDNNQKQIEKINESNKRIIEINKNIKKLETEQKDFFDNLKANWNKIEETLKEVFKDNSISTKFDEENKTIILNLKREAKTYSTGELNYIVFLINILEFEYSNKKTIVIDDPLSSYDIKKQYEIVFDIIKRLVEKGKKAIIFTHNINLINIINSQYPNKFLYKYFDMINNTLNLYNINLNCSDSVLNIDNLKDRIKDENKYKKWIELLLEKDDWKHDDANHKIFHYDTSWTIRDCCNDDLVKIIDNFSKKDNFDSFEKLSLQKIIYITALRVWLEKKMMDNFNGTFSGINELFPKIECFFKHRELWKSDLKVEQSDLVRKKVMLNQNDHYKSQIIPFHYALSVSYDDIAMDIENIKNLFI